MSDPERSVVDDLRGIAAAATGAEEKGEWAQAMALWTVLERLSKERAEQAMERVLSA